MKFVKDKGWQLCLILLICYDFFRLIFIPEDVCKVIKYALFAYFAVSSYLQISSAIHSPFKKCINGFFVLLFLSMISAQVYWGQEIQYTFISSFMYFGVFLYFYLHRKKYSPSDIERGFLYVSIIFFVLFVSAHIIYPQRIVRGFGEVEGIINTSRGLPRIRLTLMGAAPIYFLFFYYIRKLQENRSLKNFVILLVLFAVIVMQLGRTSIFLCLLLGILYYSKEVSFSKKICAALISIGLIYVSLKNIPFIVNMVELTQEQQIEGGDYVRALAYDFYLHHVSPNIVTDFIGNGQYSLGHSALANYIDSRGRSLGLIPADVGYAYIFINFGYLGWMFWLLVLFFVIFTKIPSRYLYVKYYVLFLYLSNFTGNTLLGGMHLLAISIYIIDITKQYSNGKNKGLAYRS